MFFFIQCCPDSRQLLWYWDENNEYGESTASPPVVRPPTSIICLTMAMKYHLTCTSDQGMLCCFRPEDTTMNRIYLIVDPVEILLFLHEWLIYSDLLTGYT